VEALTKQNGVRLLGKFKKKFKKKVKTDLPYLSFYKKKPETHIFFFGLSRLHITAKEHLHIATMPWPPCWCSNSKEF
jgi:hypothetical protein